MPTTPLKLSRWQLSLFVDCPRCFWLLKRHQIKPPEGFPYAINTAIDGLLKAEFDVYRIKGQPHPLLTQHRLEASLFKDSRTLAVWRDTRQGLRWTDPETGHTLFGAVDDILEFPDGTLAVLDYKASGSAEATVYPSYQLQMDVYTCLLQQLGYRTAPNAYFAFYLVVKDGGFEGRLPFRGTLLAVTPQPTRVPTLFKQAVAVASSDAAPQPGAACEVCRWFGQAGPIFREGV